MSMHNEDHWSDAEIPIHYPDDPVSENSKWTTSVLLSLIVAASCGTRVLPWSMRVTPDGETNVEIVDEWESLAHFITGDKAIAREETYLDGRERSGPLVNGVPNGTWEEVRDGEASYFHLRGGREL